MYASSIGIFGLLPGSDGRVSVVTCYMEATIHESLRSCKRYDRVMKRTDLGEHPCSIARTLDAAGEWWAPLVLRDVAYGVRRFSEIEQDLGISANILSDRLSALVAEGLLETVPYQERPPRHEYRLTAKGADLIPALLALMQWGDRWKWPDGGGPVRVLHEDCGHEVHVAIACRACGREVDPAELRARPSGRLRAAPARGRPGAVSALRLAAGREGVRLDVPRPPLAGGADDLPRR
jgi:DNA-binding HxlR family transcriptional regulator